MNQFEKYKLSPLQGDLFPTIFGIDTPRIAELDIEIKEISKVLAENAFEHDDMKRSTFVDAFLSLAKTEGETLFLMFLGGEFHRTIQEGLEKMLIAKAMSEMMGKISGFKAKMCKERDDNQKDGVDPSAN